jgi:hypothetical protein
MGVDKARQALEGIATFVRGPVATIRPSWITTAPSGIASAPVPSISKPLISDSVVSAPWAGLHPINRPAAVALVSLRNSRLDMLCGRALLSQLLSIPIGNLLNCG